MGVSNFGLTFKVGSSVFVITIIGKLHSRCDRVEILEACPELAEGPVLSKVEGN